MEDHHSGERPPARVLIEVHSDHPDLIEDARRAAESLACTLDFDGTHTTTVELREQTHRPTRVASWEVTAGPDPGPAVTSAQRDDDQRALGHVRGRTVSGKFAARIYDWDERRWQAALARLRGAGHRIEWVDGQVADDPSVHGGWVLGYGEPREPDARHAILRALAIASTPDETRGGDLVEHLTRTYNITPEEIEAEVQRLDGE
jgi:hypothetical protein